MSTTIEHDGFTIESNTETAAAMRDALGPETTDAREGSDRSDSEPSPVSSETATPVVDETPFVESSADVRKPKPKENVQARINQALEKQRKAEERATQLEAELRQARQPAQPQTTPEPPTPVAMPAGEKFPSFDVWASQHDGADYEDYIDARARHVYAAEQKIERARQAQERYETEQRTLGLSHQERVERAKQQYPDYQQAVEAFDRNATQQGISISPAMQEAILRSDSSADLIYWLATHPQDALQLAVEVQGLPVSAAPIVKRLLETRLAPGVRSGSGPAELSKAKPPVRPVGVSSVVVADDESEDVPIERWIARENAKDRKRGRL